MERAGLIHKQVTSTTTTAASLPPTKEKNQLVQRVRQQVSQRVVPKPEMNMKTTNVHLASERLHQRFAGNVYEIRAIPALISYLHAAAGFIPKATWVNRIALGTRLLCRMAGINGTTSTQMANEGGISDTGSNNNGPPEVSIAEHTADKPTTQKGTRRERSNNGIKGYERGITQLSSDGSPGKISNYIGEWIQIHIHYV